MGQPVFPQLTEESFLPWEAAQSERFELHAGFVFARSGGTFDHDQLALKFRILLRDAYRGSCRTTGSDKKVKISVDRFYYPDITVVCDDVDPLATVITSPHLIVEVLSPRTSRYDRVEKRAAYLFMTAMWRSTVAAIRSMQFMRPVRYRPRAMLRSR